MTIPLESLLHMETNEKMLQRNSLKHGADVGFIGLGLMGLPMAINLARSKPIIVWNRSLEKCEGVAAVGAAVARDVSDLFNRTRIVFLMLEDEAAVDSVLARNTAEFGQRVAGHIIVHMGTTSPQYSQKLGADIQQSDGEYVECPVSGSRAPAEKGALVAMLAGEHGATQQVRPLLAPMCRQVFPCGDAPNALLMKLAVNIFLITSVTGLAEALHFAEKHGLDRDQFRAIVDAGPMASDISTVKLDKMVHEDFSAQAAISDVLKNNRLIAGEARLAHVASPLLDACHELFEQTLMLGHAKLDMAAVLLALRAQTRNIEV